MSAPRGGLPGLRGIEHVGLTVPDLEAAIAFFVDVLGCEHIFDGGSHGPDPMMARRLGVVPETTMRYGFLRCRTGPNLEVFEYAAPEQAARPPRNSDVGGHHLAFYVDAMGPALDHLRAHGIEILGEPEHIEEGPATGSDWVYFRAPWGLQLELVSFPNGKGPEGGPGRRLWHPAHPGA